MHVNHILNCGLFYESKNKLYVHGYIDVDWANKIWNKKSISFMFSYRSDVINGTTKNKIKIVVLSSTKVK